MKKRFFFLGLGIFFLNSSFAQSGEWTWVAGDSIVDQYAVFGTIGVPGPLSHPAGVYEPVEFIDTSGNLWLHGGFSSFGTFEALFKYDIVTGWWTHMTGLMGTGAAGTYGTKGVPDPSNRPPHRSHGAASWVGLDGTFWMFGGISNYQSRNDLWKYDPSTNIWTWMSGFAFGNDPGAYGTKGVPATYTLPPARHECVASWVDSVGNLWFFGGIDYNFRVYNDLWRYDIVTNQWTWMSGCNCTGVGQSDVYGTLGVSDPANVPGARAAYAHWTDNDGNFWMFGGYNFISVKHYNDMWKYDPHINEWTWMNGPQAGAYYHYGTKCVSDTADYPPPITETRSCWQDTSENFYLFGGAEDTHGQQSRNDMWMYSKKCNAWTWVHGNNVINDPGSFGTKGISSPSNLPRSRMGAIGWTAKNGSFYLYGGGSGLNIADSYSDFWKFETDPSCPTITCAPPTGSFTSATQQICPGTCISFQNLSVNGVSYDWYFPGASPDTSTSVNPMNVCYNAPGSYDVQLIASNSNGNDSIYISNFITVYPYPSPQGIQQSGDTLFANQGANSYQWYFNGAIISGATNYFYVAPVSGDYNVVATDANGCEVEAVIFNVVADAQSLVISHWSLYPNPVDDKLVINGAGLGANATEISIYNILGKKVYASVDLNLLTVDCKLLPSGLYHIAITAGEKIFRSKFVKQ